MPLNLQPTLKGSVFGWLNKIITEKIINGIPATQMAAPRFIEVIETAVENYSPSLKNTFIFKEDHSEKSENTNQTCVSKTTHQ